MVLFIRIGITGNKSIQNKTVNKFSTSYYYRVFYQKEGRPLRGPALAPVCPILWIRVKTVNTQLSLTFFHSYRPIRPIYQTSKKIIFLKKSHIFGSKMKVVIPRTVCREKRRFFPLLKVTVSVTNTPP